MLRGSDNENVPIATVAGMYKGLKKYRLEHPHRH